MESAGRPWQAIAVAVCVLGLAVSGWPPPSEGIAPLGGVEAGQSIFSQPEETGIACILVDETTGFFQGQPLLPYLNGPGSEALQRYFSRLGKLDEPLSVPIDLTWPSLIVDPRTLTAGMPLSGEMPAGGIGGDVLLHEPVLVFVFGDSCEWDARSDVGPGDVRAEDVRVLEFLEMTVSSEATRVLYCDPGLMTEPNLFLVLSPVQTGPVTLCP